jgi:hypothetical protein
MKFDFQSVYEQTVREVEANVMAPMLEPRKQYTDVQELFADQGFIDFMREWWPLHVKDVNDLSTQNGGMGQEVGKFRERALLWLWATFLGEDAYRCDVDDYGVRVAEKGKDAIFFGNDVSIKTVSFSGNTHGHVKISWIEDKDMAKEFELSWIPKYDLALARLKWGSANEGIFYIPRDVQLEVVAHCKEIDLTPLKTAGGYSKGTSIKYKVCNMLVEHPRTLKLLIPMPPEQRNDGRFAAYMEQRHRELKAEMSIAC